MIDNVANRSDIMSPKSEHSTFFTLANSLGTHNPYSAPSSSTSIVQHHESPYNSEIPQHGARRLSSLDETSSSTHLVSIGVLMNFSCFSSPQQSCIHTSFCRRRFILSQSTYVVGSSYLTLRSWMQCSYCQLSTINASSSRVSWRR